MLHDKSIGVFQENVIQMEIVAASFLNLNLFLSRCFSISLSLSLSLSLPDSAQSSMRRAYTRSKTQPLTTDDIDCRSEKHSYNKQLIFRTNQQIESNSSIESMIPMAFIVRPTTFAFTHKKKTSIPYFLWIYVIYHALGYVVLGSFGWILIPFILIWFSFVAV